MERTPDPVNTPDALVPVPDPPARRRAAHTPWRRRRALRLLVEGGVIAVSVFLSLWADQWREDRNTARDGDASLRRIVVDLQKEGANLTRAARVSDMGVAAITGVLTSPSSGITLDSVAVLIPRVMLSQVYRPSAEEYAGLRGAGRLGIISNQELASALGSYYADLEYVAEMYRYDIEQSHVVAELMYPHIQLPRDQFIRRGAPAFPQPVVHASFRALAEDRVFANEMNYLGSLKQMTASAARRAAERAEELVHAVETELAR